MKVRSEEICKALEEYGGDALMALPNPAYKIGRFVPSWGEHEEHRTVSAHQLAIERIRELEEKLAIAHENEFKTVQLIESLDPGNYSAEYDMAWKLLCETARKAYYGVKKDVVKRFSERSSKEAAEYYYD